MKIIFEDKSIIVLDKPAGVLVHPTEANEKDTLVDWLTTNYPEIKNLAWPDSNRPGIVHRLDKDTSGVIILAKDPKTLAKLQDQFKNRVIEKQYLALVLGDLNDKGEIKANILRGKAGLQKVQDFDFSPANNLKPAQTNYEVISRHKYKNNQLTYLRAVPKTGRMHQIRAHFKHLGSPIIGDPLYNTKLSRKISNDLGLDRQFLHAQKLKITHPETGKIISFESQLPKDLKAIMLKL